MRNILCSCCNAKRPAALHPEDEAAGFQKRIVNILAKKPADHCIVINGERQGTKNADTYTSGENRIQLIKHYRLTPELLLQSFDFNICQFAWTEEGIYATQEAVIGTLRKHLAIATITKEFAIDSLRRAFKYQRKGFIPCDGTIRDISNVIATLTKEEIEAQVVMSPHGGRRIVRFD